jgi:CubicO group peptidase (beta-lactamase class C family)
VAVLVDRGLIRYEDKVASVWPEFAANGKENVTIAQLMSHQAGLNGFAEPTSTADMYDWSGSAAKLARQKPAWESGTASSYHALTYGWLAGEIVRRVSKKSVGQLVRDEIAKPFDADIFIGLPESEDHRAAEMNPPGRPAEIPPLPPLAMLAMANPQPDPLAPNTRAWRAAEIPAANGQANAMGLARLYATLVTEGGLDGRRLISQSTFARMIEPATSDGRVDMLLGFKDCWGMGVALNTPGIYGSNPRAFGHSGWGGSFGCADPDTQIAIGYVCNQMGPELVGDPRTAGLCASVFASAG